MATGLDNLKHLVVLMMSGRSFDHMLGGLTQSNPKINGLSGNESNPDISGALVKVSPSAQYVDQLTVMPDDHFPGVDLQIFGGSQNSRRVANMQGFIKSYSTQAKDVEKSRAVMNYFPPDKIPILTTLATEFAVFNGWFSSVPGPSLCNRAFAHYGTSFGQVSTHEFHPDGTILSASERMIAGGHTTKIYLFDRAAPATAEMRALLETRPQIFGTFDQFLVDCHSGTLPAYSYLEPCHNHHTSNGGAPFWHPISVLITTCAKASAL
jgi:phospholipase C